MDRRDFLKTTLVGSAGIGLGNYTESFARGYDEIPKRRLGKTDQMVTIIGLGGAHLNIPDEQGAQRIVHKALDFGVNFFDNAWNYGHGVCEERLGRGLGKRRKGVFVMSKDTNRRQKEAWDHIHESLRRLNTDYIDLWQFHGIDTPGDVQTIFGPGGAMEAADRAKREGKIRYIGITGHRDPQAFLEALKYHEHLSTFQIPINPVDPNYLSFIELILPELVKNDVGVLAMKTTAGGNLVTKGAATAEECLRYVWSLPVSMIISGCEKVRFLEENVNSAKSFSPMSKEEMDALVKRLKPFKGTRVETYKKAV